MRKPHSVCIGLCEVAGYCSKLRDGFSANGIRSDFINLSADPFAYGHSDTNIFHARYLRASNRCLKADGALSIYWSLTAFFCKMALFVFCAAKYDAFVFVFGTSFFRGFDLPILRLLGKPIAIVFLGSDSRPLYLNGSVVSQKRGIPLEKVLAGVKKQKRIVAFAERWANFVVDHPPAAHLHERSFVPFLRIGFPMRGMLGVLLRSRRSLKVRYG